MPDPFKLAKFTAQFVEDLQWLTFSHEESLELAKAFLTGIDVEMPED